MPSEKFTAEEATKAFFGKDFYEIEEAYDGINGEVYEYCKFEGIARKFFDVVLDSIEANEKNYCFSFGGETVVNPLNTKTKYEVGFSKAAYYQWWLSNPRGLACPEWFRYEASLDSIDVGEIPPPIKEIIHKREINCVLKTIDKMNRNSQLSQHTKAQFRQNSEAPNDQVIIDGLTVADVRALCERSGALASMLRAAAEWRKVAEKNSDQKAEGVLKSRLKEAAKRDGWGTQLGEISPTQSDVLFKLMTDGFRSGGRPRKISKD